MHRFSGTVLLTFAAFVALSTGGSDAAQCTDADVQTSQNVWTWATTTSACAQYAIGNDYVSAPCTAVNCVAVMEQVGEKLPDCTVGGVNNKIEVQNAMTACNGGDTTSAGEPTTLTPAETTAPTSTFTPSTGSTSGTPTTDSTDTSTSSTFTSTECTDAEFQTITELYDEAAATSACASYASNSSLLLSISAPCSETACVDVVTQLADNLPDCEYAGINEKSQLADSLAVCSADFTGTLSAVLTDSSSPTPSPSPTSSSTSCTSSQVAEMSTLYTTAATSSDCSAVSTISTVGVYISTLCSTSCVISTLTSLADDLPNCYYDYEFSNKKESFLSEIESCVAYGNASSITATFYPESTAASGAFSDAAASVHRSLVLALLACIGLAVQHRV
ncbi:hypothetical protein BBJ28_00005979 [Nothophytophthora sp. Chile5]|nr:hypothetical protein BBJ28_00005979 [Nothophytophthora sp. Chile5]